MRGVKRCCFLHADTTAPPDPAERIAEALAGDAVTVGGNFGIRFDGDRHAARFLTCLYPKLGKLGLCYGDSGIFVRASTYEQVGGFKSFPIFEDLDLMRRLSKLGCAVHLPVAVVTSSRRFDGRSFVLTFARWSIIRLAVAHSVQCPYCIEAFSQSCLEAGSNMEQMTEAIHMASAIRGGASLIHGLQAHNSVNKVSM